MTSVSVAVSLYPLSRSAGEGRVRAILRFAHAPSPAAPPLIPTFSRKREKGNGTRIAV